MPDGKRQARLMTRCQTCISSLRPANSGLTCFRNSQSFSFLFRMPSFQSWDSASPPNTSKAPLSSAVISLGLFNKQLMNAGISCVRSGRLRDLCSATYCDMTRPRIVHIKRRNSIQLRGYQSASRRKMIFTSSHYSKFWSVNSSLVLIPFCNATK